MANAVTPTSWFYSLYTHALSNQSQRDYPSKLEISFLLDSGASISVLKYPTYVTFAKFLDIKQNNTLHALKTFTVANQTEVFLTPCYRHFKHNHRRQFSSIYSTFCSRRYKIKQRFWYTFF